jgi:hypothetical protein
MIQQQSSATSKPWYRSVKVWVAVATAVVGSLEAQGAVSAGTGATAEQLIGTIGTFATGIALVLGQGMADFGKNSRVASTGTSPEASQAAAGPNPPPPPVTAPAAASQEGKSTPNISTSTNPDGTWNLPPRPKSEPVRVAPVMDSTKVPEYFDLPADLRKWADSLYSRLDSPFVAPPITVPQEVAGQQVRVIYDYRVGKTVEALNARLDEVFPHVELTKICSDNACRTKDFYAAVNEVWIDVRSHYWNYGYDLALYNEAY